MLPISNHANIRKLLRKCHPRKVRASPMQGASPFRSPTQKVEGENEGRRCRVMQGQNILLTGKPSRASTTTFDWKLTKGTRVMTDPNGKNVEDWVIRRLTSYWLYDFLRKGFNDCTDVGWRGVTPDESLRYSSNP